MEFINHNKDVGERNDNFKESSFATQFMLDNVEVDKEYILQGLDLYYLGYRNNDCITYAVHDEVQTESTCRYESLLKDPQFRCSDPRLFLIPVWSTEALWKELPDSVLYDSIECHKKVYYDSVQGWLIEYMGIDTSCEGLDYVTLLSVSSAEVGSKDMKDVLYEALIRLKRYIYK